ncbi:DNA-binding protein [Aureimonas altamirensis]|nr:DNA-binding protein [Aureimonas altamirensis]UHD44932.1 DNA-binding protein [Aureimonas altamirensis]
MDSSIESSNSDVVWGVENIAKVINSSPRATYHMLTSGHLPARQVGSRWVGSRSKLLATVIGEDD